MEVFVCYFIRVNVRCVYDARCVVYATVCGLILREEPQNGMIMVSFGVPVLYLRCCVRRCQTATVLERWEQIVRRSRRLKRLRRVWAVLGHHLADIKRRGEASLSGRQDVHWHSEKFRACEHAHVPLLMSTHLGTAERSSCKAHLVRRSDT